MKKIWLISCVLMATFLISCEEDDIWIPKPTGYLRKNFPEKKPIVYHDTNCPFTFELVDYAKIVNAKGGAGCHKDIFFEDFGFELNLGYAKIDSTANLFHLTEYVQKKIAEHTQIARGIQPTKYENDSLKTYGMLYRLDGDVALNGIFFLTDSTDHFVSGLMSFDVAPNYDSLQPSLDYLFEDIDNMLKSFRWLND